MKIVKLLTNFQHGKKIDTGKFFKKNEKSNNKNCPRFRRQCPDYSWEIHAISPTINSEGYINLS
jgi:hypothetical protein